MATIFGTAGADTIIPGFSSAGVTGGVVSDIGDLIVADAGNDTLTGGAGNDSISAGADNDLLDGGLGNDNLTGGAGDDTIRGGPGTDTIAGGGGFDILTYALSLGAVRVDLVLPGNNTGDAAGDTISFIEQIIGSDFNDTMQAIATDAITLTGGGGDDVLRGSSQADLLDGGADHDSLFGSFGNDTLHGGAGNDTLDGSIDADAMFGGAGDDTYFVNNGGDTVIELPGEGTDVVYVNFSNGSWTSAAQIEVVRVIGFNLIVTGTGEADVMVSASSLITIDGAAGDDVLWGTAGSQTLRGGEGNDVFRALDTTDRAEGGAGNDQYVLLTFGAIIVELAGEGIDVIWAAGDGVTAGDHVEITRLAGTATLAYGANTDDQVVANPLFASTLDGRDGDDVLWGSAFADTLIGGAGNDIFRGQGGADSCVGGTGNDQYVVLDAGVIINEAHNGGYDTVWVDLAANTAFVLADYVERGNLSGAANRLTGNLGDNVLVGDAVASMLDGGWGNDTLFGSGFADTLTGGAGHDDIYTYGGADRIRYTGTGWGHDRIAHFTPGLAKLDFTGSGIVFNQLTLTVGGGNTVVTMGADSITVFGVLLSASDFIFG